MDFGRPRIARKRGRNLLLPSNPNYDASEDTKHCAFVVDAPERLGCPKMLKLGNITGYCPKHLRVMFHQDDRWAPDSDNL